MAFTTLSEDQEQALEALEVAVVTRQRAELSKRLAEERIYFIELTRALFSGDPWFLDQTPGVQAVLRASHAEDEAFERRRVVEAMTWLANTETLIGASLRSLGDESDG